MNILFYIYYSALQHKADPVYSPELHVAGHSWRLKVYPVSIQPDSHYIRYMAASAL